MSKASTLKKPKTPRKKAVELPRRVLCEYKLNGRMIKRWVKPYQVVEAKRGCGCMDFMYAKDAGKGECFDCFACKAENGKDMP